MPITFKINERVIITKKKYSGCIGKIVSYNNWGRMREYLIRLSPYRCQQLKGYNVLYFYPGEFARLE